MSELCQWCKERDADGGGAFRRDLPYRTYVAYPCCDECDEYMQRLDYLINFLKALNVGDTFRRDRVRRMASAMERAAADPAHEPRGLNTWFVMADAALRTIEEEESGP